MLKDHKKRMRLFIGNCTEEVTELANQIGYPVLLIPFGTKKSIRIKDSTELTQKIDDILNDGIWGLVHVLRPLGKYADEY